MNKKNACPFDNYFDFSNKRLSNSESSENKKLEIKPKSRLIESSITAHISMYNSSTISLQEFFKKEIFKISKTRFYLYEHFLLWIREYFKLFLKTKNYIFNEDAYLPKIWKIYIALIAASTLRSEYLYRLLEEQFLEAGGDESWLIYGYNVVPEKLKRFSNFCTMIINHPWRITKETIQVIFF